MEHLWRPRPQAGNFCPTCSNSHFPFCPPIPQYIRPPPPEQFFHRPLPHTTPFDPFGDQLVRPAVNSYTPPSQQFRPRPWDHSPNFNPGMNFGNIVQTIGVKRMRFDSNENYTSSSHHEDRRLGLIHDHGSVTFDSDSSCNQGYKFPRNNFENGFPNHFQRKEGGYSKESNFDLKQNFEHQPDKNFPYNRCVSNLTHNHPYENRGHPTEGYNNNFEHSRGNDNFLHPYQMHQTATDSKPAHYSLSNPSENLGQVQHFQGFNGQQPPLPNSPPPPLPELPRSSFLEPVVSSSATKGGSFMSPYTTPMPHTSKAKPNSNGYHTELEVRAFQMSASKTHSREIEEFPYRNLLQEQPKIIDASHILRHPHRASRPDHIVIILRGLPGSGKSYTAKMLRDLEVENGGSAPRIHSMDDYFMVEVEKVQEGDGSKSSASVRGKNSVTKKVMEYCYEPEMEEAYRSSMLKAFKKTLDEGSFSFVIVDDRNLRVADFAQFWATAKRSGYEVYLLESTYKDPMGCATRNVHGFSQHDIQRMANKWEEAPSLYMKLDSKSLFHGDALKENGIQEVDMDIEDDNHISGSPGPEDSNLENIVTSSKDDAGDDEKKRSQAQPDGKVKGKCFNCGEKGHWKSRCPKNSDTEGPSNKDEKLDYVDPIETVKELGKSKWSNDLDEDDIQKLELARENISALSGITDSYSKQGKSVRWADEVGFSIGARKASNVSLVIGPGTGYNLKSNPLPGEEKLAPKSSVSKRPNIFQEQLRAEGEAFKAVFDKRRQRIGLFDLDEE